VRGLWCATLTPLDARRNIDSARFVDHVRGLFAEGIDGIVPFGTTGEGQSFGVAERMAGLEALVAAGIPPASIVPGTGCAALTDTIALTRHATDVGCAGVLVLPPFFFKDVTDEGLYASYAALVDAIADTRLRLYLYHIPQVTAVPISAPVIERLRLDYPAIVAGLKDSAGDLVHSQDMLARFPDLAILVGHEPHLPSMLAAGGAGTIGGLVNLFPRRMRGLFDAAGTRDEADALAEITRPLDIILDYPLLPALKALQAELTGDDAWCAVRPPLAPLPATARSALLERLRASHSL
jgi:4-hydroxy-tetrahydrodipicolinate synthase